MSVSFSGRLLFLATLLTGLLVSPAGFSRVNAEEEHAIAIRAANAVVVHAETGRVLFEKEMNEPVAPASLTKIFTATVALESASLSTEMMVEPYDLVGEASIGLMAGETISMESLLHGLLLTSGNDAAMTIARELGSLPGDTPQESVSRFVDRVNATAQRMGMDDTVFRNPHGLDQSGHVSSARDIAAMTMYALDNPVFARIIGTPYHSVGGREMYNVNALLDFYPGLIGGKTGVTTNSGYSLMQAAHRDGETIVVVLLGSDRESWYLDAERLLNFGFEALETTPVVSGAPIISFGGASSLNVPEVSTGVSVGGALTVDRLNDHEAVVRSSSPMSPDDARSWRWALVSVGTMAMALVVVLNFPAIVGIGALAIERSSSVRIPAPPVPRLSSIVSQLSRLSGGRSQARRDRRRSRVNSTSPRERWARDGRGRPAPGAHSTRALGSMNADFVNSIAPISPAQVSAEAGIRFAMQSRYHVASEEFRTAVERDPEIDFTKCPGFWRMQPMGYIAAAKAYVMNDRVADAKRLLTVAQLAFKSNDELARLFERAIAHLED